MRQSPKLAGPILSAALKQDRAFGSRDRPLAGDLLLGLIRHEQALARIHDDPVTAWEILINNGPPELAEPPDALAVALSLPDWLSREWEQRLGERVWALGQVLCERAPLALRVLKAPISVEELGIPARAVGARGIVLEERCNLQLLPAYKAGLVEVQDLGSQQVAEAAFLGVGARVLDLCAGAGGKSLALAGLGAEVQAWDLRVHALEELKARARRCGLKIKVAPPEGRYDLVLVDAPCSGTGVLRRHPENRWKLNFPTEIQKRLLGEALNWAPRVVYATCALALRENEELVRYFGAPAKETTLWPQSGGADGFYWAEFLNG